MSRARDVDAEERGSSAQSPTGATAPVGLALRVVVLSRYELTRAGLTHLLANDAVRTSVVGDSADEVHLRNHDVAVYDLAGQGDMVRADLSVLLAAGIPVVAVIPSMRRDLSETALEMGVADVVHMDVTADALLQTLERAAAGQATTPEAYRGQHRATARAGTGLSPREVAVLELVATGLLNQEIAKQLYLSINSVKTYIRSAYRKIDVTRRAEAVLWAVDHGLGPTSARADRR